MKVLVTQSSQLDPVRAEPFRGGGTLQLAVMLNATSLFPRVGSLLYVSCLGHGDIYSLIPGLQLE